MLHSRNNLVCREQGIINSCLIQKLECSTQNFWFLINDFLFVVKMHLLWSSSYLILVCQMLLFAELVDFRAGQRSPGKLLPDARASRRLRPTSRFFRICVLEKRTKTTSLLSSKLVLTKRGQRLTMIGKSSSSLMTILKLLFIVGTAEAEAFSPAAIAKHNTQCLQLSTWNDTDFHRFSKLPPPTIKAPNWTQNEVEGGENSIGNTQNTHSSMAR